MDLALVLYLVAEALGTVFHREVALVMATIEDRLVGDPIVEDSAKKKIKGKLNF